MFTKTGIVIVVALLGVGAAQAASFTSAGRPKFELIASKSYCWEDLSQAYVRCSIQIKNLTSQVQKMPDVNVWLRYNDGSTTIVTNTTDALNHFWSPGGQKVCAHCQIGDLFAHSYNETKHSLLQAAASLNLDAKSYPYIRVKSPVG